MFMEDLFPHLLNPLRYSLVDKFTKWILQERKKDLLLQCIEELEQQNNKQYH